jgi:hypothetical protein
MYRRLSKDFIKATYVGFLFCTAILVYIENLILYPFKGHLRPLLGNVLELLGSDLAFTVIESFAIVYSPPPRHRCPWGRIRPLQDY